MTRRPFVCFGLMMATGCGEDPAEVFAQTCLELRDAEREAGPVLLLDGEYTLFHGNDPERGWQAYCDGMLTPAPREYLVLNRNHGDFNYSEIARSGIEGSESLRITFEKVRIDPARLELDITDLVHIGVEGDPIVVGGVTVTDVPFGVAIACGPTAAAANIDLSETGFELAPGDADDLFCARSTGTSDLAQQVIVSQPVRGSVMISVAPTGDTIAPDQCAWVTPDPCIGEAPWTEDMTGVGLAVALRLEAPAATP